MRYVALLFAVSLMACATTKQVDYLKDPRTGELVKDRKGDLVIAKVDEHNFADPLGHGQRDSAAAEQVKANATATKAMAQACLESVENPPRPGMMGSARIACAKGAFMEETGAGWNYFGGPGMAPYFIPYGGPMSGGYNQPFYDNGPTSGLIMDPRMNVQPLSNVYSGPPRMVRIPLSTGHASLESQLDTTKPRQEKHAEKEQPGQGGQELVTETAEEKAAGAKLVKEVAKCTGNRDLKNTQDCLNQQVALEAYQDSLRKLKRINEDIRLARNDVDAVKVTGSGGDGKVTVEPGVSVNPSGNTDITTPADVAPADGSYNPTTPIKP